MRLSDFFPTDSEIHSQSDGFQCCKKHRGALLRQSFVFRGAAPSTSLRPKESFLTMIPILIRAVQDFERNFMGGFFVM